MSTGSSSAAGALADGDKPDAITLRRTLALLDQLAGAGEGRALLRRLLETDEPPDRIARAIAASTAFEARYKEARTLDIGVDARKEADPAYVGLAPLAADMPFAEQFHTHFRPRLQRRADGFAAIFDALLASPRERLLIVETGCMRVPGNWDGDGQSTFMFDALVRACDGVLISIDVTPESLLTARRACSSATHLILNDSVAALHALSRMMTVPAALLYLDSYDLDSANPMPSAIHHALELIAARPLIGPGSIVCVDDYAASAEGGKGMIADRFFASIRARVLYSGYQKAWIVG